MKQINRKCIVCLSGGMDSGTLLSYCIEHYGEVEAVGFIYGSKHNPYEQEAAKKLCIYYNIQFTQIDLSNISKYLNSNLLTSGEEIPEGYYESDNMKLTVVPGRNIIFISILAGIAQSRKAQMVAIGIHGGDHAIYPDCRPSFFQAMQKAIVEGTGDEVALLAPFLMENKTSILGWGIEHKVPYGLTRTCYKAQPLACGKCGACQERIEAFANHGIMDPILYDEEN